ncbi:MAG TPA: GTP 3',8-cyclase MoaA [Acidimicrobiales bacterium]|nr:GTP 3',8-cyclase MoaA [Acidimicrobiales bacterium]
MTAIAPVPVSIRSRPDGPAMVEMPLEGPLVDRFGRMHRDLRLSVTDRCNFRCVHCLPEEGVTFLPRSEILGFDEIVRAAAVARRLGITSVRITGGEPLVRHGVPDLVARLATLGFDDLSLTTNGSELARLAPSLAAAGLHRVNVSCDSLAPERFARIRRRGQLAPVLAAMDAAESAGLDPVKVNVVPIAGVNDDEIESFAQFARTTGRIVRFIEFMPLDGDGAWRRDQVVPADEILARIHARWPLEVQTALGADRSAPAERYRFTDGGGEIGVIASVTRPFCGTCDRLRLTADGSLRNCLFAHQELSVRDLLRGGGSDEDIARLFRRAVWAKYPGHGINDPTFLRPARSMSMIGG